MEAKSGTPANPSQYKMTDPRFRIRPMQQVVSACTGAMITACFSKLLICICTINACMYIYIHMYIHVNACVCMIISSWLLLIAVTPLDVIKTRLQAQQSALLSNKCFLYCNGLMDHICPCGPNTPTPTAASAFNKLSPTSASSSSHFTGTIVSRKSYISICPITSCYSLRRMHSSKSVVPKALVRSGQALVQLLSLRYLRPLSILLHMNNSKHALSIYTTSTCPLYKQQPIPGTFQCWFHWWRALRLAYWRLPLSAPSRWYALKCSPRKWQMLKCWAPYARSCSRKVCSDCGEVCRPLSWGMFLSLASIGHVTNISRVVLTLSNLRLGLVS